MTGRPTPGSGTQVRQTALDLPDRLPDPVLVLDQREPHEPVAAGPEADPWRDRHVAFGDHLLGELDRPQLAVRLGDRHPGEHRAARLVEVPADPAEAVDQGVAA